jgi:2-succinyl-5-enolpyruvyl-6-hydroxy-3-cyclohexene-1-carboxylate synthase
VRIDERSAAFFAIGLARRDQRPVAIVVTSGTAAAELFAAVAEADLADVSLLVLTADRPPELHGVGAPQTMDQQNLFGSHVRLFLDMGVPESEDPASWRHEAQRAWLAASGDSGATTPGPVQVNTPFREPLLEVAEPAGEPRRAAAHIAVRDVVAVEGERVLVVAGAGADAN